MPGGRTASDLVARLVVPRALGAGIAVAFLACVAAGWLVGYRNPYRHFVRFHQLLSPESLYYPTVSQLRALATESAPAGRIAVVVGGTSIMNGVGQNVEHLWTGRLEEHLGEPYRVLNLAFRAGHYNESGALVTETLVKADRSVILVADIPAGGPPPVLGLRYDYMLWDAYYKGLLLDYPAREALWDEAARALDPTARQRLDELRLGAQLDSVLRFNDLWTTLGYRRLFTVWSFPAAGAPFRGRWMFPDPESGHILPAKPPGVAATEAAMQHLRLAIKADRTAGWWQVVRRQLEAILPPAVRQRTLIVISQPNPYYVDQLTNEEKLQFAGLVRQSIAIYEAAGYEAMAADDWLTAADFADPVHLNAAGGAKLADHVAPRIRALAHRLGYIR